MEYCKDHADNVKNSNCLAQEIIMMRKDIEYMRRDLELVTGRLTNHVIEAEKQGGRHERLNCAEQAIVRLEDDVRNMKIMGRWFMIGSGVISGLVVSGGLELAKTILTIVR